MLNITKIPAPRVSIIDERTGLMAREWYLFFLNLFNLTGSGTNTISLQDLQIAPPNVYDVPQDGDMGPVAIDLSAINADAQATALNALQADLSELDKGIQSVALQTIQADLSELNKSIQALSIGPSTTPHVSLARYGSFYDTTSQTAAAINTAYAMKFNSTAESFGVYVGSPTSRIYADRAALYNIQFSTQIINTAGGAHQIWIWLRKNGTDVENSTTQIRVEGNNTEAVAAWNFFVRLNAGDYFELMWEVSNTAVYLLAEVASAVHPAIPSIILTVSNNIT